MIFEESHRRKVIRTMSAAGSPPADIGRVLGLCEASVYRLARQFGLTVSRRKRYKSTGTGIIRLRHYERVPGKERFHSLHIPTAALRAAGLADACQVRYRAEAGRIIIEAT